MFVYTIIICWQHKTDGFYLAFKLNGHPNQTESFAKLLWLVDLRPTTLIAMQYNLYVKVILSNILALRYALAVDDYHKIFPTNHKILILENSHTKDSLPYKRDVWYIWWALVKNASKDET